MRYAAVALLLTILACPAAPGQDPGVSKPDPEQARRALTRWRIVQLKEGVAVKVEPIPEVSLTFPEVKTAGAVSFRLSFQGPALPSEYLTSAPPIYIEMAAALEFKGPVDVCVQFAPELFPEQAADMRILRRTGNSWTDETRTYDREKHVVCGQMAQLGLLALTVRTVEGLYRDLTATLLLVPDSDLQEDLAEPIWESREAVAKKDKAAANQQLTAIRKQIAQADAAKLPEQTRKWLQYFVNRIEARINAN